MGQSGAAMAACPIPDFGHCRGGVLELAKEVIFLPVADIARKRLGLKAARQKLSKKSHCGKPLLKAGCPWQRQWRHNCR